MQLDDLNRIKQFDREDALGVIASTASQLDFEPTIENSIESTTDIHNIVLAGMGGSCLAGLIAKSWLNYEYNLSVPFEVVRDYKLPAYVDEHTLVICVSVSGNTEETLSSLDDAVAKNAQVVAMTCGGKLLDLAKERNLPYIQIGRLSQPRYGIVMHLLAITKFLSSYDVISNEPMAELLNSREALTGFADGLTANVATEHNLAKRLAFDCAGKTPIVFTSSLFYPLAYKWKTSFNENAKNTIWCNEFPEFNHNEFIGWSSHPVEKPFTTIVLRSSLDNPRILERFDLSDRLLSGKRPAAHNIELTGDNYIEQTLAGAMLGDFTSIYLGILNGVDPTPVELVERFKKELS